MALRGPTLTGYLSDSNAGEGIESLEKCSIDIIGKNGNSYIITVEANRNLLIVHNKNKKTFLKGKAKYNFLAGNKKAITSQIDDSNILDIVEQYAQKHNKAKSRQDVLHTQNSSDDDDGEIVLESGKSEVVDDDGVPESVNEALAEALSQNPNPKEIDVNVSDVEPVYRSIAENRADERLRQEYANISRYNIFSKLKKYFSRGKLREKYIQEELDKLRNGSEVIFEEKATKSSDRFQYEQEIVDNSVDETNAFDHSKINDLARDYIKGNISEYIFKAQIGRIIESMKKDKYTEDEDTEDKELSEKLNEIQYKSTNILEKLEPLKDELQLIENIIVIIDSDYDEGYKREKINEMIDTYINKHIQSPVLLSRYYLDLENNNLEDIINHHKSLFEAEMENLQIKVQIFKNTRGAFNVHGNDRKGKLYEFSEFMDKHPWLTIGGTGGALVGGTAAASAGIGPIAATAVGSAIVGGLQGIKKRGHFTKEQQGFEERRVRRDTQMEDKIAYLQEKLADSSNKISKTLLSRKINKEQDRLDIYNQTTQTNHFVSVENLTKKILENKDKPHYQKLYLALALAHLDFYHQVGHNFLRLHKDSTEDEIEQKYVELHKAINFGLENTDMSIEHIKSMSGLIDEEGNLQNKNNQGSLYQQRLDKLYSIYNDSYNQFKSIRRKKLSKSGALSALLYAGVSFGAQYLFSAGVFESPKETTVSKLLLPSEIPNIEDKLKQDGVDTTNEAEVKQWLKDNGYEVNGNEVFEIVTETTKEYKTVTHTDIVIDPDIKGKLKETLGDDKYKAFIDNIRSENEPDKLWQILVDEVFENPQLGNEVKNEMMKYVLQASGENGKSELIQQAFQNGMNTDISSDSFQETIDKLKSWGYEDLDKTRISKTLYSIDNGLISIGDLTSKEKTIISEFAWDYVHRNAPGAHMSDVSPLWQVFFDQVENSEQIVHEETTKEKVSKGFIDTVNYTKTYPPNYSWYDSLGLPSFWNTFLSVFGKYDSGEGSTDEASQIDRLLSEIDEPTDSGGESSLDDLEDIVLEGGKTDGTEDNTSGALLTVSGDPTDSSEIVDEGMGDIYEQFFGDSRSSRRKLIDRIKSGLRNILTRKKSSENKGVDIDLSGYDDGEDVFEKAPGGDLSDEGGKDTTGDEDSGYENDVFDYPEVDLDPNNIDTQSNVGLGEGRDIFEEQGNGEVNEQNIGEEGVDFDLSGVDEGVDFDLSESGVNGGSQELDFDLSTQPEEQEQGEAQENNREIYDYEIDYFYANLSSFASDIINDEYIGDVVKPTRVVEVKPINVYEGNGSTILLSNIIDSGGYKQVIGYLMGKESGKYEPIIFWLDESIETSSDKGKWLITSSIVSSSNKLDYPEGLYYNKLPLMAVDQRISNGFSFEIQKLLSVSLIERLYELGFADNTHKEHFYNNLSSLASSMIEDNEIGELVKPTRVVEIDGNKFLLSDKIETRYHTQIIGYVFVPELGKYETRVFYLSGSSGEWLCSPYIINNENNELCYKDGPALDGRLVDFFTGKPNKISSISLIEKLNQLGYKQYVDKYSSEDIKDLKKLGFDYLYISSESLQVIKFQNSFESDFELSRYQKSFSDLNGLRQLNRLQKKFPKEFSKKFNNFRKGENDSHPYFGDVETFLVDTKLKDGSEVTIEFATAEDEPNLFWVKDIYNKNYTTNSFGVRSYQINTGLLTINPLVNTADISEDMYNDIKDKNVKDIRIYTDIRSIIQENAFIKQFKEQFLKEVKKQSRGKFKD